jgi:adenylate kinase family enzyme
LLKRGRPDDTREVIKKRITEYKKVTLPIINYFKGLGIPCIDIDGSGAEEHVKNSIRKAISSLETKS